MWVIRPCRAASMSSTCFQASTEALNAGSSGKTGAASAQTLAGCQPICPNRIGFGCGQTLTGYERIFSRHWAWLSGAIPQALGLAKHGSGGVLTNRPFEIVI